jgi:hypothetical protein
VTLSRLWAFLAVALPVLAALLASLPSVDLAYHLRAGAEILQARALPTVDTWTFTAPGAPWVDQQWGAQVILSGVYQTLGWTGLAVLRAALVGVIFGCLFVIGRHRGLGERRAAWLTLAAFIVAAVTLALRPQLFGMALFAVVLLLVVDRREHPRRLWAIPVLVLVWANLHGSFFLGPLVLGLAWLEDLHDRDAGARRVLGVTVVSALAACLTPVGPAVWVYAIGLSTNAQVTQRITEWQPTSLRDVPGILFFTSAMAVVVLIARRGRMTPWPELAWLGVFFVIGVYAVRGVAWWPLAASAAVAGRLLTEPEPVREPRIDPPLIRRLNLIVAGVLVLAGVALLPLWRPIDPGLGAPIGVVGTAPPGITGALREQLRPGDHLFNPQPWGSWFEFAFPETRIALDSRIEMFPADVWDGYDVVVHGADGWQDQLARWGVTIIVAAGGDEDDQVARLEAAGWTVTYHDEDGTVLRSPAT